MQISQTALPKVKTLKLNFSPRANLPEMGLAVLIFGYIVVIMALHIVNLSRFRYGFDLSFYEQAVWNTVHGRFLEVSATDFSSSLFGTDAILILALLAPFYAIVPSTLTLLFLETLVVALAALPVYWLGRDYLKSRWAGLLLATAYLFLLSVQNGNLYEWRERPMAMGFLLFAFYFYQKGRFKTFLIFAVLTLCCRPENGLVLAMLGIYGWIRGYPRKLGWRYVVGPLLLGLVWFGLVVTVVIPANSSGQSFALAENYGALGKSPGEILKNLVSNPLGALQIIFTPSSTFGKLVYIPLLLLPFLALPLFSPSVLLMALPPLALNLLSIRETQYNPYDYHYQGSVVPWLLIATIFSIQKIAFGNLPQVLQRWRERWKSEGARLAIVLAALVLTVTLGLYLFNFFYKDGNNPFKKTFGRAPAARIASGEALLKLIPADAPLAISNVWATHVPMREGLWLFAVRDLYSVHPDQHAQYIFLDEQYSQTDQDAALIDHILHSPDWQTVQEKDGYILLKRK